MLRRLSPKSLPRIVPSEVRILLDGYRLRLNNNPGIGNPLTLLDVSPDDLQWHIGTSSIDQRLPKRVCVIDGDWDKKAAEFETNSIYRLFTEHFTKGVPWEKTDAFEDVFGDEPPRDRQERINSYEKLYDRIQSEGYKSQSELKLFGRFRKPVLSEIHVCIGRDGRMIVKHGQHRVSIAKILDLDSVPVWVRVRHSEWQELRNQVWEAKSIDELAPELQEKLSHPDLQAAL